MPKTMTLNERNDLAVQLYTEGASIGRAAKVAGLMTTTVKELLKTRGVAIRPKKTASESLRKVSVG